MATVLLHLPTPTNHPPPLTQTVLLIRKLGNYGNSAAPPTHPHPPPTTTDPDNVADDPMSLGHIAPHDFVAQWNKLHRHCDANMFPAHFAWMAQKQREWIETAPGWCCACVRIKWTETLMVFDNKINSHLSLQGMWNRSDSPGHNLKNKQENANKIRFVFCFVQ